MNQQKTDTYTKVVLSVIALCLTALTVKQLGLIPQLYASELSSSSPLMETYGLVPLNEDGSINVKLSVDEEININIVGIRTSDVLDVNIDQVGGYGTYGNLPVKLED